MYPHYRGCRSAARRWYLNIYMDDVSKQECNCNSSVRVLQWSIVRKKISRKSEREHRKGLLERVHPVLLASKVSLLTVVLVNRRPSRIMSVMKGT